MPPPTQRRPRTRLAGSSPPDELHDSSPSRPRPKRRKVGSVEAASSLSPQDQVNAVIASLALPDDGNVAVAKQYANERNFEQNTQGVTAYAKVSGATWTYYIKDLLIRMGRPPDNRSSASDSPTPDPLLKQDEVTHIDLGPSKLISRSHAIISYDTNGGHNWQIQVLGRNGVKVDDEMYKKDSKVVLRSGCVIEIGGIQMMFVLPNKTPTIAPSILRRARLHQYPGERDASLPAVGGDSSPPQSPTWARAPPQQLTQSAPLGSAQTGSHMPQRSGNSSSSTYHRGVLMQSTEDVDYSHVSMKDVKPPYSYALLIAQAILSSEGEQLTLAAIYQFIQDKYAFYRHSNMGWQNSIRHNLSLNKAFRKIPRRTDEPGKGMKWELLPEHRDEYIRKLQKPQKTVGRQSSSQPGSPSSPRVRSADARNAPSTSARLDDGPLYPPRRSSRSTTPPPVGTYTVQPLEAYTPDRGSRLPALRSADRMLSDTPGDSRIRKISSVSGIHSEGLLSSQNLGANPNGDSKSLVLSPSQPSSYDDDNPVASTVTPAPQRQHPRLAPPSTGQLPSSYLPTSSPAPFWKYVQFGSTPAKPECLSPLKDLHSSSPPPVPDLESSSRIRELGSPLKERGTGSQIAGPRAQPRISTAHKDDDDDDDDGLGDFPDIDLTKGFEKIGKFHMNTRLQGDGWS